MRLGDVCRGIRAYFGQCNSVLVIQDLKQALSKSLRSSIVQVRYLHILFQSFISKLYLLFYVIRQYTDLRENYLNECVLNLDIGISKWD